MKINLFEGARRVALLGAALVTIVTAVVLVVQRPYQSETYVVDSPDSAFRRIVEPCPSDAANHYFTANISTGKEINIRLCILAASFDQDEVRLIPYKTDERGMWGDREYSDSVRTHKEKLKARFRVPVADERVIASAMSQRYRDSLIEGFGYLLVGLAIFAAVVWAIGWIMRGFLGIPRGTDMRPD
jgi:hypothetical protein